MEEGALEDAPTETPMGLEKERLQRRRDRQAGRLSIADALGEPLGGSLVSRESHVVLGLPTGIHPSTLRPNTSWATEAASGLD